MSSDVTDLLRAKAKPFASISDAAAEVCQYFDSFGDCKVLLLGDASHGTSEFYSIRAEITKHMIKNHGFNIIAVEADWPDAESIDRYVRHRPGREGVIESVEKAKQRGKEPAFMRFPTWMWRNIEVHDFVEWLRDHNKEEGKNGVGFYGLDLYSMSTSMKEVIHYLDTVDPEMAEVARNRYEKLMVWAEDPHEYGLETLVAGFKGFEKEVIAMLQDLLSKRLEYSVARNDGTEFHSGEQNARVVADAEQYYRAIYYGRDESWNLRDTHMFQTLVRVLKHRGDSSKAIVWAHNSHLGDARATSMGWARKEINIGQLCKETFGSQALTIGCLSNTGTVAAAKHWDGDMQVMEVNPGIPNSYEDLLHSAGIKNFALDLRQGKCDERLRELLREKRLERFIGVIYRPQTELQSHYSSTVLPEQFDGLVWFDATRHVGALEVHQPQASVEYDESWPFGL